MLDTSTDLILIQGILAARHEQLVGEQRMHRLAAETRATRGTERAVPRPRRRLVARAVQAIR